ncbi:hypothetical protein, partial [Pseudomonas sp.]|uniref:hypothetical protein n=1 Tax=Pseudomonas sp. TaxID=306 RepID=UPI002602B47A
DAFIVGVGTHLMNYETSPVKALQMVSDAGITAVKDDAYWSTAEPTANQLRIVAPWRTYLNTTKSNNLTTLTILDYSTNFHDNLKPRTPEVKTAYLKYVDYVTRQLPGKTDYWEIWNEWDLEGPKDPKLSADYATLVKETVPLIRKNDPKAKILAGSVTPEGMNFGFADRLIDAGILDQIDGLSIHPYVHCAGRGQNTPEAWAKWVRDYVRHVNEKAGREIPIYLTEVSWPSHTGNCGNTPETVASYIARTFFLARTIPSLKGMWWYDLVNDGLDKTDQEHNFGLLDHNLDPKPGYGVLKAISPFVRDYTYDPEPSTMVNDVYLLYFNKGTEHVVVGWVDGRSQEKQVTSSAKLAGKLQLIDTAHPAKGQINTDTPWACSDQHCAATVTLTNFPKIISLNAPDEMVKR